MFVTLLVTQPLMSWLKLDLRNMAYPMFQTDTTYFESYDSLMCLAPPPLLTQMKCTKK